MKTATQSQAVPLEHASELAVGSVAPYFSGIDQNGKFQSLDRLATAGPVVVIFFRGHWCYFCRKHITEFQKGLDKMTSNGFPIVLITPQKPDYIAKTVKENSISFPVLHDSYNYIMTNYKVARKAPKTIRAPFKKINLVEVNGAIDPVLPVPATYIIGQDGLIKYGHFNLNYALRSSFKTVAEKVKELREA